MPDTKHDSQLVVQDAASLLSSSFFPVQISRAAISGVPTISDQRLPSGRLWQAAWRQDDLRRQLLLVCMVANRGQRVTQRADTGDMMDALFGTPSERKRLQPKIQSTGYRWIWNGEVEWMLGSIQAPIKPNIADPSTYRNGKCRFGPDRRYCLSFIWQREDAQCMIGGGYCRDVVQADEPDPIEMLQDLALVVF